MMRKSGPTGPWRIGGGCWRHVVVVEAKLAKRKSAVARNKCMLIVLT